MKIEFEGSISSNGILNLDRALLQNFLNENKNTSVLITLYIEDDLDKLRRTYFYLVNEVSKNTGYSKNEVHSIFKSEVLKRPTTKHLTNLEWMSFITNCEIYMFTVFDILT